MPAINRLSLTALAPTLKSGCDSHADAAPQIDSVRRGTPLRLIKKGDDGEEARERWRDHLAAARDANIPFLEYARRHGLKVHNLYDANRRANDAPAVHVRRMPAGASPVGAGAFVPIVIEADANATNAAKDAHPVHCHAIGRCPRA